MFLNVQILALPKIKKSNTHFIVALKLILNKTSSRFITAENKLYISMTEEYF